MDISSFVSAQLADKFSFTIPSTAQFVADTEGFLEAVRSVEVFLPDSVISSPDFPKGIYTVINVPFYGPVLGDRMISGVATIRLVIGENHTLATLESFECR
jgi:hypothetical protein